MIKSEAMIKYEELLLKLWKFSDSELESEEADRIRDEADPYWHKLTEQEKEELRQLSISLGYNE